MVVTIVLSGFITCLKVLGRTHGLFGEVPEDAEEAAYEAENMATTTPTATTAMTTREDVGSTKLCARRDY